MIALHRLGQAALLRAAFTVTAATLVLACLAGVAHASAFANVFNDYRQHGAVSPCTHSVQELKQARQQVPPDIAQYAPDFPAAIDSALAARARGTCASSANSGGAGAGSTGSPSSGTGANGSGGASSANGSGSGASPKSPGAPSPPSITFRSASATHRGAADPPAALIVLAAIAAALALPSLAWGISRWQGWEPMWLPGMRHALGEANFRAGNGWSEFSDWFRLGH